MLVTLSEWHLKQRCWMLSKQSDSPLMNNPRNSSCQKQRINSSHFNCVWIELIQAPEVLSSSITFCFFRLIFDPIRVDSQLCLQWSHLNGNKHALNTNHTWKWDLNPLEICLPILIYLIWDSYLVKHQQSIKILWLAELRINDVTESSEPKSWIASRLRRELQISLEEGEAPPRCSSSLNR